MSVNSIKTDSTAFILNSLSMAVPMDKSPKETQLKNEQPASQKVKTNSIDNLANVSASDKTDSQPDSSNNKSSVRAMSHIVQVYNPQGKLRTKFMDSNNNLIYQIPSEMVAKMEDQMLIPESSTNIKG